MYRVKEIHKGGKYLSSLPYGFTGGYFSPNSDRAMTFTSIEAASKAGNACFNCAKLMVIDQDNKPVKNLHK